MAIYQAYLELHEHPAIFTALNADTMEVYTELVPFDAALAQRMSDRAVKVITATEAVKHEHQQDVKLALHCGLLDFLKFVTFFGRFLEAGNAFFGELLDDLPALTFCKVAAGFFLHGDVVFLDLSLCRNTV